VVQGDLGGLVDQQHLETLGDQEAQMDHVYREHPAIDASYMKVVSIKYGMIQFNSVQFI
jgi:hypothetical protein